MKQVNLTWLAGQVHKYLIRIEELFGPRDPRFEFGAIRRSNDSKGDPQTHFVNGYHENGGCVVDIHISHNVFDNNRKTHATWQIAHECVHMLDPCRGGEANVLEEGLATWFQNELRFHPGLVQLFIRDLDPLAVRYTEAMTLVRICMPNLANAVREIRSSGIRLKEIKPELLKEALLPNVIDDACINRLCERFS